LHISTQKRQNTKNPELLFIKKNEE
jgi:hypothetical protein